MESTDSENTATNTVLFVYRFLCLLYVYCITMLFIYYISTNKYI